MEQILVIPRSVLNDLGAFQGFANKFERYLEAFFAPGVAFFTDRAPAEENPTLQQIIPYCLIAHEGKFLVYTRGKLGGEKRLHAKKSLGLGGHINPQPGREAQAFTREDYQASVLRELLEEIHWDATTCPHTTLGLIKDDSNPVGQVHLGVCVLFQPATPPSLEVLEGCILEPQWLTYDELAARREEFETWSQLVIDELFLVLSRQSRVTVLNDSKPATHP